MKILNLAGGGTKISGHAGACEVLVKGGYSPDIITGVSAGAVIALPVALGLFDEIRDLTTKITLKQIFDKSPITNKGKLSITAYFRFLRRKESLGLMNNLKTTLSKVITKQRFYEYKQGNYPGVYIMAVNSATGKRHFYNVKKLTYNDYLTLTIASASIPLANKKVRYKGLFLTDGGVRNGIISHWIFEKFGAKIKESISIYLRPQKLNDLLDSNWEPQQAEDTAGRDFEIMMLQTSISDEKRENELSNYYNIKNTQLFIPKVLTHSFDTNPIALKLLYQAGKEEAYKYLLNDKNSY